MVRSRPFREAEGQRLRPVRRWRGYARVHRDALGDGARPGRSALPLL